MTINAMNLSVKNQLVTLRPLMEDDFENWRAGYLNELPPQHKYDPEPLPPEKLTKTAYLIRLKRYRSYAQNDQIYVWGVFCSKTGQHVGIIDVATILRGDNQWANIGYTIHNQFWRRGFASAAVKEALLLSFNLLSYHRIEAAINLDNQPSISLVEKLGFIYEGVRRSFIYENDNWVDHHIYSIIPSDLGLENKAPDL